MEMGSTVASEIAEVLEALGVDVQAEAAPPNEGDAHDLRATINGRPLRIEVKTRATVTPGDVASLLAAAHADDEVAKIVVADRVTSAAREMLRGAGWGWLDRRG